MSGFRKFLMRGNLIDLAVAVVVGVAFNTMVQALIKDLITPLIAAVGGEPDFSSLTFRFHGSTFHYGAFINTVVSFLVITAVVYFMVVAPATRLMALAVSRQEATERACPECLSDIPVAARRCKFCTAEVDPAPAVDGDLTGTPLRDRLTWRPRN
jgi:large conductance mechanosensitive channel